MPDQDLLLHYVVPGIVAALLFGALASLAEHRSRIVLAKLLCVFALIATGLVGQFLHEGIAFPPDREWHTIVWSLVAAGLLWPWFSTIKLTSWQFYVGLVATAIIAWFASDFALPTIPFEDAFDTQRTLWRLAIVLSTVANLGSMQYLLASKGGRWAAAILVAQLAATSTGLMTAYATIAAASLGYLACICVLAILFALQHREQSLLAVLAPLLLTTSLLVANIRIYSFEDIPMWVFGGLFFLPTLVASADWLFFRRVANEKPKSRVAVAAFVSTIISATAIIALFL